MFAPRVLAALALGLAVVAALPADKSSQPEDKPSLPADKPSLPADKPSLYPAGFPRPITVINDDDLIEDGSWFPSGSTLFANLFAPLWRLFPTFADIGPKIIADDDKFKVIVNVKDYKKDDLKVKIKGPFVLVQGTQEAKHDERDVFASQFFHTYTLPVNASAADVTAELSSDGFLAVICPLNGNDVRKAPADLDVPILETGKPYPKEDNTEKPIRTTDINDGRKEETTPASEREKEETTPASEREQITEKDNIIPHGTEPVTP